MSPEGAVCKTCDCDVVVIGAGPAGLSTAVYAGAEECQVRLLDAGDKPGGQAGQSTQIRNYFGFPDGVSGPELAGLGVDGAISFGVDLRAPVTVHSIEPLGSRFSIRTIDEDFTARSVVIATGATARRHRAPGVAAYHGRGVSYRGPDSSSNSTYSGTAYIVGGGNSAGQAATFLARAGCDVHIVIRGAELADSMSKYLISEIFSASNITLHTRTELTNVVGETAPYARRMTAIGLKDKDGRLRVESADHLYLLLGAAPNTAWLNGTLALESGGHILTGTDLLEDGVQPAYAELDRLPYPHETSVPGIFAAGDVRYGALKRVAAAVGEGAGAYFDVHRYINS